MRLKLNYGNLKVSVSYKLRRRGNRSLVFIHGLGCTKEIFDSVWHFPGFDEFTILTIDLVGFGDSSKPQEFSYEIEDQAEIVKCVLEKHKLENVNLIGHSMGGMITVYYATHQVVMILRQNGNIHKKLAMPISIRLNPR